MIRNLKTLGLALVAVFAMSAVAASAASAVEYHSESTSTTYNGIQGEQNVLTAPAGALKCTGATFTGTASAKTTTDTTVTPAYTGCTLAGAAATIHINGCTYTFTQPTVGTPPAAFHAEVHLLCPAGKKIEVTAPTCTIDISPQTPGIVDFTNIGAGTTQEIEVRSTVKPAVVQTGTKCLGNGGAAEKAGSSTLTGTVIVTGSSAGIHTGIWVA